MFRTDAGSSTKSELLVCLRHVSNVYNSEFQMPLEKLKNKMFKMSQIKIHTSFFQNIRTTRWRTDRSRQMGTWFIINTKQFKHTSVRYASRRERCFYQMYLVRSLSFYQTVVHHLLYLAAVGNRSDDGQLSDFHARKKHFSRRSGIRRGGGGVGGETVEILSPNRSVRPEERMKHTQGYDDGDGRRGRRGYEG